MKNCLVKKRADELMLRGGCWQKEGKEGEKERQEGKERKEGRKEGRKWAQRNSGSRVEGSKRRV
jgi:hypothetical protein